MKMLCNQVGILERTIGYSSSAIITAKGPATKRLQMSEDALNAVLGGGRSEKKADKDCKMRLNWFGSP